MTPDKSRAGTGMGSRQKLTIGVFVIIVAVLGWQVTAMLKGDGSEAPTAPIDAKSDGSSPAVAGNNMQPPQHIPPKQVEIEQPRPMTEQEAQLVRLRQETQANYLKALNELQLLRVAKDIADTTKDISKAKLDSVTAEKKIVEILTAPTEAEKSSMGAQIPVGLSQDVKYTVVSVSQLQYRWSAVMNYKGNLFSVHTGDILPPDNSKVVSIAKDSVTLEKDGAITKVSLTSAI